MKMIYYNFKRGIPPYMRTQQLVLSPRLALIQEKGGLCQVKNRAEKLIQCGTLIVRGTGRGTHLGGMSFSCTAFEGLVMV